MLAPSSTCTRSKDSSFLPRARSVRAREYSVIIDVCASRRDRRSPRRDWQAEQAKEREAKGHGSWTSLPVVPHRPAGCRIPAHAVGPGAEKWCLSKNEQRRRLLDSPPACWQRVLTQAPAAFVSEQLPQVEQTRRQPRQRCTSPAHRITASRPSLSSNNSSSSIIIIAIVVSTRQPDSQTRCPSASPHRGTPVRPSHRISIAYRIL